MHVLFDIGHPAHVHLFRNVAQRMQARGDKITVTIRDRGIIGGLLDHYGLPYTVASKPRRGLVGSAIELAIHNWQVLKAALPDRPDFLVGTSVSVAHVGRVIGRPSIVLNEDDADYVPLFAKITYPFANRIVIPAVLRDKKTAKVRTYDSYHELAYLHPNHFKPDQDVVRLLGIEPREPYFIIRLVSLTAHHDAGERGLSEAQVLRLIALLEPHGRVFINAESSIAPRLQPYALKAPPESMHDLLAHAKILISDSQTMTMEAALLGRPAIRCNSFVGRCSVIAELEQRYRLAWGFKPQQFEELVTLVSGMVADPALEATMAQRHARVLAEKVDLTDWLLKQFDSGFA